MGIHGINALADFCIFRQVFGHIIFNIYPAHCKNAERKGKQIEYEKHIPLIHYEGRSLCHETVLFSLGHENSPLLAKHIVIYIIVNNLMKHKEQSVYNFLFPYWTSGSAIDFQHSA